MNDMTDPKILIVGAGPSGLILALSLRRQNVPFRWIDAASGPGLYSRAMGVHARTLELYRMFGISDEVMADGIHTLDARIQVATKKGPLLVATLPFSTIGRGMSKYPFILNYPQDHHEKLLTRHLSELGVECERNTSLTSLHETPEGTEVTIKGPNGEHKHMFEYVVGADGAHSKVRHALDVGFQGGTYTQRFYVADVKLAGEFREEMMVTLSASALCIRLPVTDGQTRLIGVVPKELQHVQDIAFESIQPIAESLLGVKVESVRWFSSYAVHHRVASRFSVGKTFLVGDASHLHSPMGGQGMNTGLGDAINLAWKLGYVVKGKATAEVLDTYDQERRPFGEKLVQTTDRAFGVVMQDNILGTIIRRFLWPTLMFFITRLDFARRNAFRFVSQIHISYANSKLSQGALGGVKAGDRMPWIDYGNGHDNHETFDGLNWQLHVYGGAKINLEELEWISVHHFPFDQAAKRAGFRQGAAYLIRPDAYTALIMNKFDYTQLSNYVERWQLKA